MSLSVTVIIPTHRPHPDRLGRVLAGLSAQTLPAFEWETLLIDNGSSPALDLYSLPSDRPVNLRILPEPKLGLTHARRRGLHAAQGDVCVFVDDDNVLTPSYLADAVRLFGSDSELGAIGGPSRPEFAVAPAPWIEEFFPLLAVRDLGPRPLTTKLRPSDEGHRVLYPSHAPIGAGLALRRHAMDTWLAADASSLSDRQGQALSSGGDNDIVLTLLRAGWRVGYFPALALTHLIPASRLDPAYLGRLNRGIQKSWMQVLTHHDANPWSPIPRWTVPLRQLKAWFTHRAWSTPAARIRWQGACGHFEGRATA
jgi:glycosyltransferase involved in cell wall biosynthesis